MSAFGAFTDEPGINDERAAPAVAMSRGPALCLDPSIPYPPRP